MTPAKPVTLVGRGPVIVLLLFLGEDMKDFCWSLDNYFNLATKTVEKQNYVEKCAQSADNRNDVYLESRLPTESQVPLWYSFQLCPRAPNTKCHHDNQTNHITDKQQNNTNKLNILL